MAVLLVAIPLLVAFISILNKKLAFYLLAVVAAFNVVLPFFLEKGLVAIGGFGPVGINLLVDQYSLIALVLVNVLFFLTVMINCKASKKLATVLIVLLAGLNGLILTNDLFNLFVFLEITGISAYLLTTENNKPVSSFNYLVLGTVGSGLYLLGLIILYSMIGTLNMSEVFSRVIMSGLNPTMLVLPFMLMFIGLGVESKLLPFNSWVKGVLEDAKPLSGTLIASVIAGAVLFVFGRLLTTVMVVGAAQTILTVILLATIVAGEVAAFKSRKLREILLFSSVGQAGLVIYLFVNGFLLQAILLVIANVLSKFILFIVGATFAEAAGNDDLGHLAGAFKNNLILGTSFTVAALSVAGLPLFFGFVVKLNILLGMFGDYDMVTPAIVLFASIIEGTYLIKMLVKLWYGNSPVVIRNNRLAISVLVVAMVLVILGVWYQPVLDLVEPIKNEMIMLIQGGSF